MENIFLENIINKKLINNSNIIDNAINGLQIKGKKLIKNIVIGVTLCQEIIDFALLKNADAIIVHHGIFCKNDTFPIFGTKKKRLKKIINNNINLYAWHLPLDIHPRLGNNAQLANILSIKIYKIINPCIFFGKIKNSVNGKQLKQLLQKKINKKVIHFTSNYLEKKIKNIGLCTGSGHKFFELAIEEGIDAFISGEASESTIYISKERNVDFYSAGHHATEKGGILALGKWLKQKHSLNIDFFDFENPI
ncbi:ybgI [Wigglesworthia glossinidia endosymbiont of Glossina brevipalpis]|uniref:YbgI protein n=1 Tax=Wigglesworthia glossinidia brevipalpis TaxID=36870 RepID=Q8D2D0_WIGBR|nr:ybgI [Wigglesworthia glossinidia endosymbiont of Glossina brevipalpis]